MPIGEIVEEEPASATPAAVREGCRVVVGTREVELKKELESMVKSIAADDVPPIETFERAMAALVSLRSLRVLKKIGSPEFLQLRDKAGELQIPQHFKCPISSKIMIDPVVVSTGQTYDRPSIQARLDAGDRICPRTQEALSHCLLTPNHLVRNLLVEWCESNGIELHPRDKSQATGTEEDVILIDYLFEKLCGPPSKSETKRAANELRLLTKNMPSIRALLGERPEAITMLFCLLSHPDIDWHQDLKEDVVTIIFNISIPDSNKEIVGNHSLGIPTLINALKKGTMESRGNAAATLFTLSALHSNMIKIGELGAIKPLLVLLDEGSETAKKDAASAIFNLCKANENKEKAVSEGAVRIMVKNIMDKSFLDESLAILALLVGSEEGAVEVGANGGVPFLLGIIRKNKCARNTENSAVILFAICTSDRTVLKEIREEEDRNKTISCLTQNGTPRAQRKAKGILERLHRTRETCSF